MLICHVYSMNIISYCIPMYLVAEFVGSIAINIIKKLNSFKFINFLGIFFGTNKIQGLEGKFEID